MNQTPIPAATLAAIHEEPMYVMVDIRNVGTNVRALLLQQYPDGDLRVSYKGHCYIVARRPA